MPSPDYDYTLLIYIGVGVKRSENIIKSDSPPNYLVITPSILWGLHLSYPQKSFNSENQL